MVRHVCLTALLWTVSAAAQWIDYPTPNIPRLANGKVNLAAPVPKAADGKPDLTGLWQRARGTNRPTQRTGGAGLAMGPNLADFMRPGETIPPLLPPYDKLHQERQANFMADRPSSRCLPHSIPDQMLIGVPMKIVQNPGLTLILYEEFARFRQIFTDGRAYPPDMSPAWFGYSIGRWDGDVLVVDSKGFNDLTWLDDAGHPHSDALHTVERFRRQDFGHMEIQLTIDDPKAYTKPWTLTMQFQIMPDTELIEDVCENEKDAQHAILK